MALLDFTTQIIEVAHSIVVTEGLTGSKILRCTSLPNSL